MLNFVLPGRRLASAVRVLPIPHLRRLPSRDWIPTVIPLTLIVALGAALTLLPLTYATALVFGAGGLIVVAIRPAWALLLLVFSIPWSLREISLGPLTVGATEGLVGLVLAAWLAQMVARRRVETVHPPLLVPLLLFLGAILLSLPVSQSLPLSIKEIVKWLEVLGIYLFLANTVDGRTGEGLVAVILLAGISQALLGIYQFFWRVGPPGFLVWGRFIRAYGTFEQPNPYAGYLGLILPLALAIFLARHRNVWLWALSGLALALMGAALGMTLSRGAWLGFVAATGVVIALGLRQGCFDPDLVAIGGGVAFAIVALFLLTSMVDASTIDARVALGWWMAVAVTIAGLGAIAVGSAARVALQRRWFVATTGTLIIVAAAFVLLGGQRLLPSFLTQRLADLGSYTSLPDVRGVTITNENFALVERLAHWQAAWGMITDHPWRGVGIGNYAVAYPAYALPRWEEPLGHAHNYYLNIAAEAGLVGLVAYLFLFIACFWYGWRALFRSTTGAARRTRHQPRPQGQLYWPSSVILGSLGVLIALSVHNVFDNLYVHGMYVHVGMILGLIYVMDPVRGREGVVV